MATITRESLGTLHDKITVKLAKEDYMPSFEKSMKEYAKKANIPGFRKGMVPAGLVRKMYGPTVIKEEVVRNAAAKLESYMKEEKLAIFAQPMMMANDYFMTLNFSSPSDIDFDFEVGLKPTVELGPVIKNSHLSRYKITITDQMMDDEMERLKRRFGNVDAQQLVTSKENIIYANYEECDSEGKVLASAELVEDTKVLDKLPSGLQSQLMDKKPEDTLVFRPADVCTSEELESFLKDPLKAGPNGAEQYYKLTLTKIGWLIPLEMGEDLYKAVYKDLDIKTEAEFREKIKEELGMDFNRIAGERLQNEIFEYLVHQTPIELPVNFLKRWMMENNENPKTAQEVENEWSGFEHQLRWQLISDQIVTESGVHVSREEVYQDVKAKVLGYFGLTIENEDDAPWLEGYMSKMSNDEKLMDETYRRILTAKMFWMLEQQFPVEIKDISEEEFFKLGDAHAAHHHHH